MTLLYEFKDKKYPGVYKEEIRQAKDAYVKAFKDKEYLKQGEEHTKNIANV